MKTRIPEYIQSAIDHFIKYNLDVVWVVTNAPARSAFNQTNRTAGQGLLGRLISYDFHGNHLDKNGEPQDRVDKELKLRNMVHA